MFGANAIGLERRGFDKAAIEALQTAFRLLTRAQLNTSQAIERIRAEVPPCAEVEELIAFIRASERGVDQVDALRADRRQRPLPAAGARKRAAAGARRHGDRDRGGSVAAKSRRWRRAATGSRSGN